MIKKNRRGDVNGGQPDGGWPDVKEHDLFLFPASKLSAPALNAANSDQLL